MTYSDVIILRLQSLCRQRGITVNMLATLRGRMNKLRARCIAARPEFVEGPRPSSRRARRESVQIAFAARLRRGNAGVGFYLGASLLYRSWLNVVQAFHPLSFQREKKAGGAGKKR